MMERRRSWESLWKRLKERSQLVSIISCCDIMMIAPFPGDWDTVDPTEKHRIENLIFDGTCRGNAPGLSDRG